LTVNLEIDKEISLNVDGRMVKFCEYKSITEDDFVKVCTYEHQLGVDGEYAWIRNKYPGAIRMRQVFDSITINNKEVKCDILIIKTTDGKTKEIYFDISQMMEDLHNITTGETNKDHWDDKAKIIYDKLINEYGFNIYKKDEESLYKSIDENVSIGFDIEFYFGFIFKNERLKKSLRTKYENIIKKYADSGFIGNIFFGDKIIGGHIKIDNFDDINIVYSNYKALEEEAVKE